MSPNPHIETPILTRFMLDTMKHSTPEQLSPNPMLVGLLVDDPDDTDGHLWITLADVDPQDDFAPLLRFAAPGPVHVVVACVGFTGVLFDPSGAERIEHALLFITFECARRHRHEMWVSDLDRPTAPPHIIDSSQLPDTEDITDLWSKLASLIHEPVTEE